MDGVGRWCKSPNPRGGWGGWGGGWVWGCRGVLIHKGRLLESRVTRQIMHSLYFLKVRHSQNWLEVRGFLSPSIICHRPYYFVDFYLFVFVVFCCFFFFCFLFFFFFFSSNQSILLLPPWPEIGRQSVQCPLTVRKIDIGCLLLEVNEFYFNLE